jgi:hypothetical protein
MAEEMRREGGGESVVLAMYPGEVETFVFPFLFFFFLFFGQSTGRHYVTIHMTIQ